MLVLKLIQKHNAKEVSQETFFEQVQANSKKDPMPNPVHDEEAHDTFSTWKCKKHGNELFGFTFSQNNDRKYFLV